jgi:hypothetical protein
MMIIGHLWLITKRSSSRFDVVIYRFLSRNVVLNLLRRYGETLKTANLTQRVLANPQA